MPIIEQRLASQVVGNIGLYLVCYRLSRLGWNVMPTARNARGIDLLAYTADALCVRTIQVKSLSRRNAVPLGGSLDSLLAQFVVVCRYVTRDDPECFVMTTREVRERAVRNEKDGKEMYWLGPTAYEETCFRERWSRIGKRPPRHRALSPRAG